MASKVRLMPQLNLGTQICSCTIVILKIHCTRRDWNPVLFVSDCFSWIYNCSNVESGKIGCNLASPCEKFHLMIHARLCNWQIKFQGNCPIFSSPRNPIGFILKEVTSLYCAEHKVLSSNLGWQKGKISENKCAFITNNPCRSKHHLQSDEIGCHPVLWLLSLLALR